MRERVLRDHSQSRTWPGKQKLNGCKMKRNLDNVVVIDVDSEGFDNVIVIDVPESLQHKIGGSSVSRKGKNFQFHGVISIDDDEDGEYPEMGTEGGGDLESDTSSSRSYPASDYGNKSAELNDDECHVVQEKNSAFGVSKCKKASGKDPCGSRYGLSESSSSDDDSDCEVMEGSFGQLHKEWEKASLKRKSNVCKGKSVLVDQASPSCLNNDAAPNVDVEVGERDEQPSKTAFCCDASKANYENQNFSTFVPTDDGGLGSTTPNHGMEHPFVDSDGNADQEGFHNNGQSPQGQSSWSNQYEGEKHCHHRRAYFTQNFLGEHFNFRGINRNFHCMGTAFQEEEAYLCKSRQANETRDNNDRVVPSDKFEEFLQATSSCSLSPGKSHHTRTGFTEEDKPVSGEPMVSNSQPSCETGAECGVAPFECNFGAVFEESFSCKTPSSGMPEVDNEKTGEQDTGKPDVKVGSSDEIRCAETQNKQRDPCLAETKGQASGPTSSNQVDTGTDPIHAQGVSLTPAFGEDIINEREKLKETDAYKRAMEEEWASRQRQLQIQV